MKRIKLADGIIPDLSGDKEEKQKIITSLLVRENSAEATRKSLAIAGEDPADQRYYEGLRDGLRNAREYLMHAMKVL